MIAETAQLAVDLTMHNGLAGPAAQAEGQMAALNATAERSVIASGKAAGGLGLVARASSGMGGALAHAKGAIGGLLSGPLGLIGLGAGAAGAAKFLRDGIGAAEEFGRASLDLQKVIGGTVSEVSTLVDTLDKFGVKGDQQIKIMGMLERNVGTLAKSTKGLAAFQKQYGISLTDNRGKIADANELLKRSADYFNSNATASDKATVLAKLWGRQWQTLIPLLSKGRAGINKEEATALRLNADQIRQLAALRGAQRELNDTWGDTQVLLGIALVPTLTKMARALNSFIGTHQQDIVNFFRGGAQFAEEMGSAIGTYVIPGIRMIGSAWNAVPPEVRKLLIGGFAANKILKVTFGFDPLKIVGGAIGDVIGKQVGGIFGRGGNPTNPVWVAEAGGGGLGGGGVAGAAGKGGLALVPTALAAALGVAVAAQWKGMVQDPAFNRQLHDIRGSASVDIQSRPGVAALQRSLDGIRQGIHDLSNTGGPLSGLLYGDQIRQLQALEAQYQRAILAAQREARPSTFGSAAASGRRDQLRPEDVTRSVREGNRDLARSRDLTDLKLTVGMGLRQVQSGISAVESAGFAAVVSVLWAVKAAVSGLPSTFGTAADQGRSSGGRVDRSAPESGARRNSRAGFTGGSGMTQVNVRVNSSARDNHQASTIQFRYGPTPSSAGSA